jgi:hypothetical protein
VTASRGATFIGEQVRAVADEHGGFTKRPHCPRAFEWRGTMHTISSCLREWKDYARRGKMSHNMRPSHLEAAEKRGSRGVGRYYFRVLTDEGRSFDLYYDRAPRDTADGAGSWYLLQELERADDIEDEDRY